MVLGSDPVPRAERSKRHYSRPLLIRGPVCLVLESGQLRKPVSDVRMGDAGMLRRLISAARVLVYGEARRTRRTPIPEITPAELQELRQFFPRPKFFILGHARSGTTLLMRLVRLHPEVYCDYQAHFFTRRPLLKSLVNSPEVEEWLTRKSNRWNRGGDLSALVLRAAADFIMEREAAAQGKRIVGDKSPSSTIHGQAVRDLHALYPDAHLLHIVRDGRDVLVSERFRNFVEESRFLGRQDRKIVKQLAHHPEAFGSAGQSILTEPLIRRVGRAWAMGTSEIDSEGRRLFGEQYYVLRFEDLLQSPLQEMQRIWKFLGAKRPRGPLSTSLRRELRSNPDEVWQAARNGNLSTFLSKGHAGNWRQVFTPRDKAIFKSVAGKALIDWRYETTFDW